jgi:hypothetical protein
MLRTNFVRRAGRLLGAVTVTGVLSAGLLATAPAAAQPRAGHVEGRAGYANGLSVTPQHQTPHKYRVHFLDANGI